MTLEEHQLDPSRHEQSSRRLMQRISLMMFLQSLPLGCWGVTVGTYIAANTGEQGAAIYSPGFIGYSTAAGAIGGLLSPIVFGFISDRYFSAQRLTAALHLGCALMVLGMYLCQSQAAFFLWLLAYFQCYIPSIALTNKIGFRHLKSPDREFPIVRLFGTLGWIGAGLLVGWLWPSLSGESIEATRTPFLLGIGADLVMAAYALTLPRTPAESTSTSSWWQSLRESLALLKQWPLAVFLVVSVLACMPSMAYNNFSNPFLNHSQYPHPAALMTLGQVSELAFLWLLPVLIARFGLRTIFLLGVIAWAIRYGGLALGAALGVAWPVMVAILIHGPCYVFIYVVGQMYTDRLAPAAHRGAAQGLHATASSGVGHLLGALTVGLLQANYLTPAGVDPPPYDWVAFWTIPAMLSLLTACLFGIAIRWR